jgi:hypothetical protein
MIGRKEGGKEGKNENSNNGRLGQEACKFKAILGYTVRHCLTKQQNKTTIFLDIK